MIDSVLNLLFRCPHRRLTRPVTPVSKAGVPSGGTYVVCLDCGKHFTYDAKEMRLGKAIGAGDEHPVAVPDTQKRSKLKYAVLASMSMVVVIASAWIGKTKRTDGKSGTAPS